jgi:hypothetical protein
MRMLLRWLCSFLSYFYHVFVYEIAGFAFIGYYYEGGDCCDCGDWNRFGGAYRTLDHNKPV